MIRATDLVKDIADAGESEINVRRAMKAIIREFGGLDEFARNVVLDYHAAKEGSPMRVRLTTAMLTAMGVYGEDSTGDGDDIESVEAELKRLLGEAGGDGA